LRMSFRPWLWPVQQAVSLFPHYSSMCFSRLFHPGRSHDQTHQYPFSVNRSRTLPHYYHPVMHTLTFLQRIRNLSSYIRSNSKHWRNHPSEVGRRTPGIRRSFVFLTRHVPEHASVPRLTCSPAATLLMGDLGSSVW